MGWEGWKAGQNTVLRVGWEGCQPLPTIANPPSQPRNPLQERDSNLLNPSRNLLSLREGPQFAHEGEWVVVLPGKTPASAGPSRGLSGRTFRSSWGTTMPGWLHDKG